MFLSYTPARYCNLIPTERLLRWFCHPLRIARSCIVLREAPRATLILADKKHSALGISNLASVVFLEAWRPMSKTQ